MRTIPTLLAAAVIGVAPVVVFTARADPDWPGCETTPQGVAPGAHRPNRRLTLAVLFRYRDMTPCTNHVRTSFTVRSSRKLPVALTVWFRSAFTVPVGELPNRSAALHPVVRVLGADQYDPSTVSDHP